MNIHVAPGDLLDKLIDSDSLLNTDNNSKEIDLPGMLRSILESAYDLVPAESGSILISEPACDDNDKPTKVLRFVACFGEDSIGLVESVMPTDLGIAGKIFTRSAPYISKTVDKDLNFFPDIDRETAYETKSIIGAPIQIDGTTIGIIELINKIGNTIFTAKDLKLLKIFAGYTSTLIQNSLDAKTFKELSIHDNLTGLYNDRHLYECLNNEIEILKDKNGELSVVFLDLDNFKQVNDTRGHLCGSKVLKEIGTILRGIETDRNVAMSRYGGDEFVVVLPEAGLEESGIYAEDIRESIERHTFLEDFSPTENEKCQGLSGLITASIGVASVDKSQYNKQTVEQIAMEVIKNADGSMYKSKETGKNKVSLSKV